jgi:peptidyl-prolyl cis-trans isomerase D
MLDFLRRSATSVFAWIVLGVLALVFGLSFGLPSDSLTLGPQKIVKVHGEDIGDTEYTYQYNIAARIGAIPKEPLQRQQFGVNQEVLEGVVERIVLAKSAEAMGLGTTQASAEDEILNGHFVLFGFTFDYLPAKQGFNYEYFKNSWLASLRVAEAHYLDYQREEVLARTLRDLVEGSVTVSEAELRAAYESDGNKLSLRFARYEARAFADQVDPTPEEIDAYLQAHRDELKAQLGSEGARFLKLAKQQRLYAIAIEKPAGDAGTEEVLAAAKAEAERARTRVTEGEDFRKVARDLSTHDSAVRGGDIGWVGDNASGLDLVVDEYAATGEVDALSDVLDGETAYWVVRVDGRREGDVPEDEALRELAEDGVRLERGKTLAREAATADRDAVLGGAALTEVFDNPDALGIDVAPGDEDPIEEAAEADADRPKAELVETGPFGKGQPIPGLGPQPDIVNAAWDAETDVELLESIFEVGDDLVLVGRVSKQESTEEDYQQMRATLYDVMVGRKAMGVSARFAKRQCLEAKGAGEIKVSEEKVKRLMTYDTQTEDEESATQPYEVCERVGSRGGMLTLSLRMRR